MPTIGGVYVPDNLMPKIQAPERPRPGLGAVFGAAAEGAIGQLRYGLPYQASVLAGTATPQDEAAAREGLARANEAAARAAPANVQDLTSGRVGIGRFIGENLAASLPYMAGSLVGGVAGGLAGGPGGAVAGAIAAGVPQFSASNVARAVDEQGGLSQASAERALALAPAQAASDILVERYLPGVGGLLGGLAARQAGNFLTRTAKSVVKAGATEAVTEAGQQMAERYAAGIPVATPDAAAEYVNAAVTAFAVGGALGVGGGFRRTNALAKAPDQVMPEDMIEHIDGILSGSGRATAPIQQEEQLGLPLDGGAAVEQQLALPMQPEAAPELPASQLPQLALDPPLSAVAPETQLELGQRFTDNVTPVGTDALGATQVSPELEAILAGAAAPASPRVPLGSQASTQAIAGSQALPVVEPTAVADTAPTPRLFGDQSFEDLTNATKAKDATPEVRAEVDREIAARYREAVGEEPLTTEDFQERLGEIKSGLRGSFVQKLDATDPADLVNKIYTEVFENQNTASSVQKLAQRAGILDENLEPTERANQIEQARLEQIQAEAAPEAPPVGTPVAVTPSSAPAQPEAVSTDNTPADPAFAAQWDQLKRDAGITRLRSGRDLGTPANLQSAQAQVFRLLADDSSNAEVSQVEKLARKMGLVTDDDAMDVTPLGRQAFLTTPEGLEETVSSARMQGYTGAQASIFDRGVRAQLSGDTSQAFTSFEDMSAYEAGKVWAKDFVETPGTRTAAQTAAIQSRQAPRQTGVAVDRNAPGARRELTPAQVQQQALNRLVDAADLRTVSDSDIAGLRRMIRDGATSDEVGRALQQVQGGRTLFSQPPSAPVELSDRPSRGQPIFKEMNTAPAGPARTENRVESEAAVRAYDLRNLAQLALAEGGITEARAAKINALLDDGKVDQVARLLKAFDPDATPAKSRLPTPPETIFEPGRSGLTTGDADVNLEQALTGKSFTQVLDHLIENAPSRFHREIMRRVQALAKQIEKTGYKLDVRIVRPGDTVPADVNRRDVRALTRIERTPRTATVWLKSTEMGPDSGMNQQLVQHEMLHAVTMLLLERGNQKGVYGNTKLGKSVEDLYALQNAIAAHFNARAAAGNLNAFEQRYHARANNSLANVDEILAWGLTNPDMQRYLQSIEYKPRQSVFSKLIDMLRNLLGLDGKYDTALTELVRVSEQVLGTRGRDLTATFARNDPNAYEAQALEAQANEAGVSAANRTVDQANTVTQDVARMAATVADRINAADLNVKFRRTAMGWLSHNQLDRLYGQTMPGLITHSDAHRQRGAVRGRFEKMGDDAYQSFEKLEREAPKSAERVGKLMALTTEFQLDPDKPFDEHTHLDGDKNRARLEVLHREAVKLKSDLSRGDGAGIAMFNELRALNEAQNYARMAAGLHSLIATDPELTLGVENATVNPVDEFMLQADLTSAPAIRDHWHGALMQQVAAAQRFVNAKKGESAVGTPSEQRAMAQHLSPVEMQIAAIHQAMAGMQKAPYFHLGRFGDNFGSAVIRTNADGTVDPVAQQHVAEALEKAGFNEVQISTDNTRPKISLRFDTVDQTRAFRTLMLDLQKQGWLSSEEIKAGPRTRGDNYGTADGLPDYVQRYIQSIEASPMFVPDESLSPKERAALAERKNEAIQLAVDTWLEQQPDSSISRVLAKRYTVPGYNKDMIRNFAHRWTVGSTSLANVATQPKFNRAYVEMRSQANEALNASNDMDPDLAADLLTEVKTRDATQPVRQTTDTFDKMRAFSHAYFLGLSPAYGMINMTQLGVTALPELAKQHGYSKSFHGMRRASAKAFAILKAAVGEASQLGPKNWADVSITESVLKKAGLDDKTANFVRHMLATGTIDIGTSARALGQVARDGTGSKLDTALKYASAIGLYTETFSRLVAALAAHDLHGGTVEETAKYATGVVSNAMFDYQNWNTARQLGKQGFAGPITPLLTQFMSYSVQVTEKLYSEAADAIGRPRAGETPEQTKVRAAAARRFLAGHLTAVTALAGTLGLPFAAVFASVLGRTVDALDDDDEPFDATAAWRGFLASVLGKDVAEVVARGLPRAIGLDISARAGEQNLLPFTELLTDRRGWREAIESNAGRSIGAAPSMFLNVLEGGEKISQGDVMGGLKAMLPVAFKGPTEAYRMTQDGYVDSRGAKLPMTPQASAYLVQLLGFTPSEKAEYSEARGAQQARKGEISRQAAVLRSGIVRAMMSGDQERARELVTQAAKFDQDNPAFAVIPSLSGSIERQVQAQGRARALRSPLGVSMQDIAGQQLTSYANIDYGR